jgi:endonuclease-8
VPEGDTIHNAANRLRPVLAGHVPDAIETPQPRHAMDHWPERLAGRRVESIDAHGKHLFIRFEGELVLHSHLGMTGSWLVRDAGSTTRGRRGRAWLVLRAQGAEAVQFGGPTLELLTALRARNDLRLRALGPDIIGERFDHRDAIRRLRGIDPSRPIGDALLDQRALAGIGNIWKSESCFAAAVDPWRPVHETGEDELLAILGFAREQMAQSARDGFSARPRAVYRRAGEPCARCAGRVRARGQGDQNRTTYWCPDCQR